MKYTGWGQKYKGSNPTRPFTEGQWKKSYIKKNIGGTYESYLKDYSIIHRPKRKMVKPVRMPTQKSWQDNLMSDVWRL